MSNTFGRVVSKLDQGVTTREREGRGTTYSVRRRLDSCRTSPWRRVCIVATTVAFAFASVGCVEQESGQRVYYRNDGQVTQTRYYTGQDSWGRGYVRAESQRFPNKQAYQSANTPPLATAAIALGIVIVAAIAGQGQDSQGSHGTTDPAR